MSEDLLRDKLEQAEAEAKAQGSQEKKGWMRRKLTVRRRNMALVKLRPRVMLLKLTRFRRKIRRRRLRLLRQML